MRLSAVLPADDGESGSSVGWDFIGMYQCSDDPDPCAVPDVRAVVAAEEHPGLCFGVWKRRGLTGIGVESFTNYDCILALIDE